MMVRVYATRPLANAAVAALPGAVYEHQHREGVGADEYRIVNPGNAADRLRRNGIRTERALVVLTDAQARPCVPVPKGTTNPLAVPFDDGRGEWSLATREK